jgi:nicotinate-nucleotide--dimethylbenzimidazole phosphoribosyltransferase
MEERMRTVVTHLCESIQAASGTMAATRFDDGPLVSWLAGAQHAVHPTVVRRVGLCLLADHGAVAAGVGFGAAHPTVIAAHTIARGEAALARAASVAGVTLMLIDAGVDEPGELPAAVVRLAERPSGDLATGAALTPLEAIAGIEAGAALATALVEDGLDVLTLGGLGAGADLAASAVIAALTDEDAELAPVDGRAIVAAGLATLPEWPTPIEALSAVGGRDLAIATGVILASASMYVPVIVDGAMALAAALVAARLAPLVTGYVACAHGGGGPAAAAARTALGLEPIVTAGLGHGEGTGAMMVMAMMVATVPAPATGRGPAGSPDRT